MTDIRVPRRVLQMVRELHRMGFQRLRIAPMVYATGDWRCIVTPIENIEREHGAKLVDWDDSKIAKYTTGDWDRYFEWDDCDRMGHVELASVFIERFGHICDASIGPDPEYAAWFKGLVAATHPHWLPYAFDEWRDSDEHLFTRGFRFGLPELTIGLPPPGEGTRKPFE